MFHVLVSKMYTQKVAIFFDKPQKFEFFSVSKLAPIVHQKYITKKLNDEYEDR